MLSLAMNTLSELRIRVRKHSDGALLLRLRGEGYLGQSALEKSIGLFFMSSRVVSVQFLQPGLAAIILIAIRFDLAQIVGNR